jgi:integrase
MKVRQRRPKDAGSVVIRKRADGSEAFMLKYRGYTRTTAATSKGDALKLLPAFVAKARTGDIERERAVALARNQQPTLADWARTFLTQHVKPGDDYLATRATYENVLSRYVLPALGEKRLHEITGPMIRDCFQTARRKGRAVTTLRLTYAALSRAFNAAIDDGVIAASPLPKFAKLYLGDIPTASEGAKRRALSTTQVSALLAACAEDPSLRLFVAIMASCGLRPGEAAALRWQDIGHNSGVVRVRGSVKQAWMGKGIPSRTWIGRTKTRNSVRDLAIGPTLMAMFAAERERQEALQRTLHANDPKVRELSLLPADACIFCADPTTAEGLRQPRAPDALRAQFRKAAKLAGLPGVSPHWLRHTEISHAIAGGTPLADAARRAGHKSPAVTAAIYTHAVGEGERKAALIGDALLAPAKLEQQPNENAASSDTPSDMAPV